MEWRLKARLTRLKESPYRDTSMKLGFKPLEVVVEDEGVR